MKNTEEKSKIINSKILRQFILIGGMTVSPLLLNEAYATNDNTKSQDYVMQMDGEIAFGNDNLQKKLYQQAVEDLVNESYDLEFAKISNNPVFIIDDQEYKAKDFYLRTLEDGTVYYSNLKDKNTNLFTQEYMNGKIVKSVAVYKSSMFYDMYLEGLLNEEAIKVDKEVYEEYLKEWDGEINDKTYDNAISLKIEEYVEENKSLKK